MAQRIQTLLIDDLDGGQADGTVRFGLDGKVREWAKGQGIEIKDRGRVPASVVEQYKTAVGA